MVPGGLPRRSRGCMKLRILAASTHLRSVDFGSVAIYPLSDIEIGNPQGIVLDEFTALVNSFSHKG